MAAVATKEKPVTGAGTGACGGDNVAEVVKPGDPLPTESSLLKLEGISEEDLAQLTESPNFEDTGTEDFSNVEFPHLLFETQALYDRLQPLSVIVKDRQELVSKVILIKPMGSAVLFRVNTGEITAEVKVNLFNTTKLLEKEYIVDFNAFFTLIRNSGAKFLIQDRNGSPCITVLGGDVELESYNLDKALFVSENYEKMADAVRLEGGMFSRFLIRAAASMALATRPEDRRTRVENGTAYSNFLSSIFIQRGIELKSVSFRAIDLYFLSKILINVPEFYYKEMEKEFVFSTSFMKCAIPKIDTTDLAAVKKTVENVKRGAQFTISPTHLYKVLSLVKSMVGNSGIVKFKPEEGQLWMSANTKTGKPLRFPIAVAPPETQFQISTSIASMVSTSLMLRREPVIQVSLDEQSRMIFDGEGVEILFGTAS